MLASTIQFTTNPPTPTPHHPHKAAEHRPGNQGALPQNPDSMPPPHTRAGAPTTNQTTTTTRPQQPTSSRRVSYASTRQTNHPAHQRTTVGRPALRATHPNPAGPDPHGPDNHDQRTTPHT